MSNKKIGLLSSINSQGCKIQDNLFKDIMGFILEDVDRTIDFVEFCDDDLKEKCFNQLLDNYKKSDEARQGAAVNILEKSKQNKSNDENNSNLDDKL